MVLLCLCVSGVGGVLCVLKEYGLHFFYVTFAYFRFCDLYRTYATSSMPFAVVHNVLTTELFIFAKHCSLTNISVTIPPTRGSCWLTGVPLFGVEVSISYPQGKAGVRKDSTIHAYRKLNKKCILIYIPIKLRLDYWWFNHVISCRCSTTGLQDIVAYSEKILPLDLEIAGNNKITKKVHVLVTKLTKLSDHAG